jgi:ribosomal protein S18 acetylase RimI-like enzyme
MIRLATLSDLDQIWDLRLKTTKLLKDRNIDQWQYVNPSKDTFISDINLKEFYVYEVNHQIIGMISIKSGIEKTYLKIYEGSWNFDLPYMTIHRLAIDKDYLGKKIADELVVFADQVALSKNINYMRIDTHENNKYAIKLFVHHGYHHVGYILLEQDQGDLKRLAFDKLIDRSI